ncbi:C4-type zinc ribbon domain-containing protein [Flammeovirgaceae bacterium SG7u.111]|nr:C4-type zinc ribbon domain-containing protein [Flammeovirgaceae bacterium SG7u.132]WPO33726.1 C4-type zinc ribbon domain-containing protein [Flammeovirgaceae bacterium SG7u.111]
MESTVAKKLDSLIKLQDIDSKIDDIKKIRGDLPEEVQDLEDEIAGYQTRVKKFKDEQKKLEDEIKARKDAIKNSEQLIKKYEEQQMNVRNNREYDAITKEMELQDLEIQISQKKIKEAGFSIDAKKTQVAEAEARLQGRMEDLDVKKGELDSIMAETQVEEDKLLNSKQKAMGQLESRLANSYEKIRLNASNGLAVVPVARGACGGCFAVVPPQRQVEIAERKKLIVCEHCGRIFSHVIKEEVVEPPKRGGRKKATKKTTTKKK